MPDPSDTSQKYRSFRQRETPFAIDPIAFACALVGAPLFVAFFGFWALFIPVFALYFGGPVYLVIGTPALLWFLKRRRPNAFEIAILALAFNAVGMLLLLALIPLFIPNTAANILVMYGGFGSVMAPIWGAIFSKLYAWFEDENHKDLNT